FCSQPAAFFLNVYGEARQDRRWNRVRHILAYLGRGVLVGNGAIGEREIADSSLAATNHEGVGRPLDHSSQRTLAQPHVQDIFATVKIGQIVPSTKDSWPS